MSVLSARNVLPVVTALVSALFLVTAVPRTVLAEPAFGAAAPDALAQAEIQRCVAGGRESDDCVDEVMGKALIERAEGLARDDDGAWRAGQ